jgi:hypothetical protein
VGAALSSSENKFPSGADCKLLTYAQVLDIDESEVRLNTGCVVEARNDVGKIELLRELTRVGIEGPYIGEGVNLGEAW